MKIHRGTAKVSELKLGPIMRTVLPEGFIERIIKYKLKLKEVETISLEETIDSFMRDWHPEKELEFWEKSAEIYESKIKEDKQLTLEDKKRIYDEILKSFA